MKNIPNHFSLKNILLLLFILQSLSACSHLSPQSVMPRAILEQAYLNAIEDAKVAQQSEIYKNLVAILPSNDSLMWEKKTGDVLVVTWTSWNGYDDHIGNPVALSRPVWVTVVPEIQTFCRRHPIPAAHIPLRLEQLLGLPPGNGQTKFVEMWVSPNDLFRPSPDPEISDHEAELDFPESRRYVTVSQAHRKWINDLIQTSYGPDGYPWTRLGYTYDWGNPGNEIGLSEFVIRSGATITVKSVTDTLGYCQ